MDCARTAIRLRARSFTVFNRRYQHSASQYEASYIKPEGVHFETMKIPMEIHEDGVVFAHSKCDERGKAHAIAGSEKLYPCPGGIVTVSQELGGSIMLMHNYAGFAYA